MYHWLPQSILYHNLEKEQKQNHTQFLNRLSSKIGSIPIPK